MSKTLQVAADRAHDQTRTVMPAEVARGIYVENPPGLRALKLMHLMIATAGARMAEDEEHVIRLSDIRRVEGMAHHDRASLEPLFRDLRAAVLTYDEPRRSRVVIGGFLDEAVIDYHDEAGGDLLVTWTFGKTFRRMAAASDLWALIDRQTVFSLNSKYAVLLFQHIASLAGFAHVQAKTFTVRDLRAILGVEPSKLNRFADLNRRALQPAIMEINDTSRLHLTATPRKAGRTVASVEIAWTEKLAASATPLRRLR